MRAVSSCLWFLFCFFTVAVNSVSAQKRTLPDDDRKVTDAITKVVICDMLSKHGELHDKKLLFFRNVLRKDGSLLVVVPTKNLAQIRRKLDDYFHSPVEKRTPVRERPLPPNVQKAVNQFALKRDPRIAIRKPKAKEIFVSFYMNPIYYDRAGNAVCMGTNYYHSDDPAFGDSGAGSAQGVVYVLKRTKSGWRIVSCEVNLSAG